MNKQLFVSSVLLLLILSGCGGQTFAPNATKQAATPHAPEPVTLAIKDNLFNEEEWNKLVVEPIKTKYPYITLERFQFKGTDSEMVASGNLPDIILEPLVATPDLNRLNLTSDMNDLIKKDNVDLNKLDPVIRDAMARYDEKKTLMLPMYSQIAVMVYNKDLFDKFNVPYPKNHMTYEETIQLAKRMTRSDGGTSYGGAKLMHWFNMVGQQSLSFIDKNTGKANVSGLAKVWPLLKELNDIPEPPYGDKEFFQGLLAMDIFYNGDLSRQSKDLNALHWGMVTIPEYSDRRGYGAEVDFHAAFITSTSKHKEDAFNVISYLALNDQVQTLYVRNGKLTALHNDQIRKEYGADIGFNREDVIQTILETKPAPSRIVHPLDRRSDLIVAPINKVYKAYLNGSVDLNTALTNAENAVNLKLQSEK